MKKLFSANVRKLFSATLRARLVILILLAFIPAFSLSAYNSFHQLRSQETAVREGALRLVRMMKVNQRQMMDDAKEFLGAISSIPSWSRENTGGCTILMNRLVNNFPGYTSFALIRPNGNIFCSAEPAKLHGNIAHLRFFKEVIEKRTFGVGPHTIDPTSRKPVVLVGRPLFDANDQIDMVLFSVLDLSHQFDELPSAVHLPPDSVIIVFDRAGLILACYPDPYGWAGSYHPRLPLLKHTQTHSEEGVAEAPSMDGIDRLFAYTNIHRTPDQAVFMAVGMSIDSAYGMARNAFHTEMLSLAVVSLLALGIAWFGSDKLIIRKMRQVIRTADRIRTGDLTARSDLQDSRDEVDRLAHAVDSMADAIQERVASLQRHDLEMRELRNMNDALQACMTRDEVFAVVRQFGKRLFGARGGVLYVLHESGDYLEAKAGWEHPASKREFLLQDCWALRRGRTYRVDAGSDQPRCRHVFAPPPGSYLCLPLLMQGEILGVLHLENDMAFPAEDSVSGPQPLAESVAEHVTLTLSNLKLRDTLHAQAVRDGLTSLFNRRYMEETLIRETRNAERNKKPISIIMLDIDHFKHFNDTFGHAVGDALLREIGKMLQTEMRGGDLACRYGGEEFTIILPGASLAHATAIAETLREAVRYLKIEYDGRIIGAITASFGVASYPTHGITWETVLHAADTALLSAKQTRDRVVVYDA